MPCNYPKDISDNYVVLLFFEGLEMPRASSMRSASETRTVGRCSVFPTEKIKTIDKMYHSINIYGVILGILSHSCADGAAYITLVV